MDLPHSLFYVRRCSRIGRFAVQFEGAAPLLPVGEVKATREVISMVAIAQARAITHRRHVVVVLPPTPSLAEMPKILDYQIFFVTENYLGLLWWLCGGEEWNWWYCCCCCE